MRFLLWGGVAALVGFWLSRQFGWIRMETPAVEQRDHIFRSTGPRYRRTQAADKHRLRLRNPRIVIRRRSA